ncbi:Phospholipase A1 member A-like, partial [Homarus americanus]
MNVLRVLVVPVMVALVAVIVVKVYSSYPSGRVGVLFYYSTSLHEDRKEFKATKESIAALPVTPSTPVSIIIHGYTESSLRSWVVDLTDGMDASYPWLPPRINEEFLDAGDAILVVNIRTSSIGSHSPPGHIDFYANGGLSQPGCQNWYFPDTAKQVCNHYRAVALMIEAVKYAGKEVFSACGCPDLQSFQNNTCDCQIVNNFGLYPNARDYLTENPQKIRIYKCKKLGLVEKKKYCIALGSWYN